MGNILSAIAEDMRRYKENCERFGEEVQMEDGYPDCYCTHAEILKERALREDHPQMARFRKKPSKKQGKNKARSR